MTTAAWRRIRIGLERVFHVVYLEYCRIISGGDEPCGSDRDYFGSSWMDSDPEVSLTVSGMDRSKRYTSLYRFVSLSPSGTKAVTCR